MPSPACIILAAGEGTRLKSKYPKALQPLCGKPLVLHAIDAAQAAGADPIVVVIGAGAEQMRTVLADTDVRIAHQAERKGTGHAVMCAQAALEGYQGDVLVTCADIPLVRPQTLSELAAEHSQSGAAATVLTTICPNPTGYGRVVRDEDGRVRQIVEHDDADQQVQQIKEINTSIYCFQAAALFGALPRLNADNVQGEYYLTDVIPELLDAGHTVAAVTAPDWQEVMGINTRAQHAEAEQIARDRVRQRLMDDGVMLMDPASTFIDCEVQIGPDTVIWPGAVLLGQTRVGSDCLIESNVRIENCQIADRVRVRHCSVVTDSRLSNEVQVGPFAHIRDDSDIREQARIGSYAEVVRSVVGPRTYDKHFSYLGDAQVGADVNIGAGVITCNYDGQAKHRTVIGDGAFVGSDAAIVAPVTIGARAYIGAGSVITKDIPPDALAVSRSRQKNIEGWAKRRREQ